MGINFRTYNPRCIVVVGSRLVHTIPGESHVCALTVLNNELYVLLSKQPIDIYSTADFTRLRQFTVPVAESSEILDMASCQQKQCVYLPDLADQCIHRIGADESVCKWPVTGQPSKISVTPSSNVLVIFGDTADNVDKLMLISSENGECLRTIDPELPDPDDDMTMHHALQLNDDLYAILHTTGVSYVNNDGELLRSTDPDTDPMTFPSYMIADAGGFLFLTDVDVTAVIIFDPSLDYVCDVAEGMVSRPCSLYFDEAVRRLYVGQMYGKIVVVQL